MATQEIVEVFRNHNIDIELGQSSTTLVRALRETDPETLWIVLEEFSNGEPIGMDCPNERMHILTLSYALVDVFENNKESVTQNDIDAARQRATKTAEALSTGSSTRPDEEATVDPVSNDAPAQAKKPKRKRDAGLRPMVESMLADNPKATPADVINAVLEQKPSAKESTIRVYYSQARKALNLPSSGKRGRKSSGLYPAILKMVRDNPEVSKEKVITMATKKFDAKENTALAYISKARKEIGA